MELMEIRPSEISSILKEQIKRARAKVDEISVKVPKLRVVVSSKVAGLTVVRGDEAIGESLWCTDIALDAGDHAIKATAPGYAAYTTTATAKDSAVVTVTIPALSPDTAKAPAPATTAAVAAPTASASVAPASSASPSSPIASTDPLVARHTSGGVPALTWVLGGAGVVGLGAGAVFALMATNKYNQSTNAGNECSSVTGLCAPGAPGLKMQSDAIAFRNVAIGAFIAGGVLLGAGVVVLAIGGSSKDPNPSASVVVMPGGLGVVGRF